MSARKHGPKETPNASTSAFTWLSDIEEEKLEWLWPGYLPLGKVAILDGDPGLGKSTLTLDLVARFSREGSKLPDKGVVEEPIVSLVLSAEDDAADTIKPRLRAAGADDDMVAIVQMSRVDEDGKNRPFSMPEDLSILEEALERSKARFVVIDPVAAFLSERIQSHNDASIRRAMGPLTELAQDYRASMLLLRHLNKDGKNSVALYRGGGSIGFAGSARSVMLAARAPDGEGLVLAQTKANLTAGGSRSLLFRVEPWPKDPDIPRITWLGRSPLSADDLLRPVDHRKDSAERDGAKEFLQEILADGPIAAKQLRQEAEGADITLATLRRASKELDVHRYRKRTAEGKTEAWFAHLPTTRCPADCRRKTRLKIRAKS